MDGQKVICSCSIHNAIQAFACKLLHVLIIQDATLWLFLLLVGVAEPLTK